LPAVTMQFIVWGNKQSISNGPKLVEPPAD
jgi:hypothetical protein